MLQGALKNILDIFRSFSNILDASRVETTTRNSTEHKQFVLYCYMN
jgi:hypothetical protein